MIQDNTPIWQMTKGEFVQIFRELLCQNPNSSSQEVSIEQKKEYAYGLDGLARIIGCSKSHASKLKGKGLFDDAIVQNGRKIIIDKEKALELFNKKYY